MSNKNKLFALFFAFVLMCLFSSMLKAQIQTQFQLVAEFQNFTTSDNVTFTGSAAVPTSQINTSYLPTGIQVGDYVIDALGNRFTITAVSSATFTTVDLSMTEDANINSAPRGVGQIWRPFTSNNEMMPVPYENSLGVSDVLLSKIETNNAKYVAESLSSGGDVSSVNGQTGTVVLDLDDIAATAARKHFSVADQAKLASIESGAQQNVNADWSATTGDAQILNKPTLFNVSSVSDITNSNSSINDRFTIKGTGAQYLIQSDSVAGYENDDIAVKELSANTKYAVLQSDVFGGYDVKWFGAVGDNSVDDTQAIQRAIDFTDKLYITKGQYRTTDTLFLDNGQKLLGLDSISIINFNYSSNKTIGILADSLDYVSISNIYISNSETGSGNSVTVLFRNCNNSEFLHNNLAGGNVGLRFSNTATGFATADYKRNRGNLIQGNYCNTLNSDGFSFEKMSNSTVKYNTAYDCGRDGFKFSSRCRDLNVTGNIGQSNSGDGFDFFDGIKYSIIHGNQATENTTFGFELKGTPSSGVFVFTDNTISSNIARGNSNDGFSIASVRNINLTSNQSFENSGDGFSVVNWQGGTFIGNDAYRNTQTGFRLNTTSRVDIIGCGAFDNSYSDGTNQNGTYSGFLLESGASVQMVSCHSINTPTTGTKGGQKYGIEILTGSNGSFIRNSRFFGNVTGTILDGGSGNRFDWVRDASGRFNGFYFDAVNNRYVYLKSNDVRFRLERQGGQSLQLEVGSSSSFILPSGDLTMRRGSANYLQFLSGGVNILEDLTIGNVVIDSDASVGSGTRGYALVQNSSDVFVPTDISKDAAKVYRTINTTYSPTLAAGLTVQLNVIGTNDIVTLSSNAISPTDATSKKYMVGYTVVHSSSITNNVQFVMKIGAAEQEFTKTRETCQTNAIHTTTLAPVEISLSSASSLTLVVKTEDQIGAADITIDNVIVTIQEI